MSVAPAVAPASSSGCPGVKELAFTGPRWLPEYRPPPRSEVGRSEDQGGPLLLGSRLTACRTLWTAPRLPSGCRSRRTVSWVLRQFLRLGRRAAGSSSRCSLRSCRSRWKTSCPRGILEMAIRLQEHILRHVVGVVVVVHITRNRAGRFALIPLDQTIEGLRSPLARQNRFRSSPRRCGCPARPGLRAGSQAQDADSPLVKS
jgi:hypothetical protein